MVRNLVLLPGMDGTGDLFGDFVAALPQGIAVKVGRYPSQEILKYPQLIARVKELTAGLSEFVIVAESFSSILAIAYAAENPPNLAALVICAGFASSPFPFLGRLLKVVGRPWLFRVRPPKLFLDHYIFAPSTPAEFKDKVRENLRRVSSKVLAGRLQELLNCDVRSELARIKIPMLYLQGANDVVVKSRCFEEMRAIQPNIQLASIPAPHLVIQSQPNKSAEIILKFCSSIAR